MELRMKASVEDGETVSQEVRSGLARDYLLIRLPALSVPGQGVTRVVCPGSGGYQGCLSRVRGLPGLSVPGRGYQSAGGGGGYDKGSKLNMDRCN